VKEALRDKIVRWAWTARAKLAEVAEDAGFRIMWVLFWAFLAVLLTLVLAKWALVMLI
jgi:hypothetical protein